MKVGDLVRPSTTHGLYGQSYRSYGIVVEHHTTKPGFKEVVVVRWNDDEYELEVPAWLEIISESR